MTFIERVANAIADNIDASLPDGVQIDTRYAAVAAIEEISNVDELSKELGAKLDHIEYELVGSRWLLSATGKDCAFVFEDGRWLQLYPYKSDEVPNAS